jgi:hypothetical protein
MIYFIECGFMGPVKIGYSTNPRRRLEDLQAACPYRLSIRGVIEGDCKKEGQIQARLKVHRIHGEWFYGVREVDYVVRSILKKHALSPDDY